jgi:hypothetical protein
VSQNDFCSQCLKVLFCRHFIVRNRLTWAAAGSHTQEVVCEPIPCACSRGREVAPMSASRRRELKARGAVPAPRDRRRDPESVAGAHLFAALLSRLGLAPLALLLGVAAGRRAVARPRVLGEEEDLAVGAALDLVFNSAPAGRRPCSGNGIGFGEGRARTQF